MKIGDIVYGKVTNILGYGAFVLVDEYDGLIHISEFSDHFVRDIKEFVKSEKKKKLLDMMNQADAKDRENAKKVVNTFMKKNKNKLFMENKKLIYMVTNINKLGG